MTRAEADAVRERTAAIYRTESRRVFATLVRLLGDFDLAEEALHDAFRAALEPGTAWRRLLEANDAFLPVPSSIPVLVVQGDADVDVGVQLTRDVVRDLCAGGTRVEYQERPGVNHMDMNVQAAPQVADWVAARFAGTEAKTTCGASET